MTKKRAKAKKKKSGLFSLRYLLPAGFFLALSVFLLLGLNRNPNEIPSPLIGKAAPEFALPRLADAQASNRPGMVSRLARRSPFRPRLWFLLRFLPRGPQAVSCPYPFPHSFTEQ